MASLLSRISSELNLPSPIQTITVNDVEVSIKRDDLIHKDISGNKWRKLRLHLDRLDREGYEAIVTAGGAFSNHLAAVASLGELASLNTIGLVTHYEIDKGNPVLKECREKGMQLIPIGRLDPEDYLRAHSVSEGQYYIPPGGADELGSRGMESLVEELGVKEFGSVVVGVGYGAMIKGLDRFLPVETRIIGVTSFASSRARADVEKSMGRLSGRVRFDDRFKAWGFGRYSIDMIEVATRFYEEYGIMLDPIYTVKVAALLESVVGDLDTPILMIHSGGVQGWKGFQYRFGDRALPSFIRDLI